MPKPRRHPSNRPFLAAPRTDFYHPARVVDAALHGLDRAIRRGEGVGLVVGGPGTGKSLLLAKVAESVREDFDVALLSGARICTRRALWQSILAEVGEPYRGIDEGELRIGLIERIRGLAATGSGLVILVDEAHTLPSRLVEELRLLTNIPTPLPAVHIVLAGNADLEEMLAAPRMESLSQRIAVRSYLEPLDHAETLAYLRTQAKSASLEWDALFEPGCDDAVFTASDGVPRLINQVCDHALVLAAADGRQRATPADIAAAWREIQRLPPPTALARAAGPAAETFAADDAGLDRHGGTDDLFVAGGFGDEAGVIEFGAGFESIGGAGAAEDSGEDTVLETAAFDDGCHDEPTGASLLNIDTARRGADAFGGTATFGGGSDHSCRGVEGDPWQGPEVELVFDPSADPFEEYFEQEERVIERYVMRGPDDFSDRRHVASREGMSMARRLDEYERTQAPAVAMRDRAGDVAAPAAEIEPRQTQQIDAEIDADDSDMVVIEEDLFEHPSDIRRSIFAVRPGDYRRLFARLRRGDRTPPGGE
jgi:type II secretory pathway predicted ATPase ExeA